MVSSKVRVYVIVFALLLLTSIITVGCGQQKKQDDWVNTKSMPGHTFTKYRQYIKSDAKQSSPAIVYLGSNENEQKDNFGPQDVNFDFKSLK